MGAVAKAVRIISMSLDATGQRLAQVKFFKPTAQDGLPGAAGELPPFSWEAVHLSDVPLRHFYPLLEDLSLTYWATWPSKTMQNP